MSPDDADDAIIGDNMRKLNGFPSELNVTGLAMLRLANGCNVELFQTQPAATDNQSNPSLPGINHFSLYVIDVTDSGLGGIIIHDLSTGKTVRRLSSCSVLRKPQNAVQRGFDGRVFRML